MTILQQRALAFPNILHCFAVELQPHEVAALPADDFPDQALAAVSTRYEGRPSSDSRYWGLMAEDEDWETTAFLVCDREADEVITIRDMSGVPGVDEEQEHDYWAEPHASVNADFTRILFTSNWGRPGTGDVEMFLIELPSD